MSCGREGWQGCRWLGGGCHRRKHVRSALEVTTCVLVVSPNANRNAGNDLPACPRLSSDGALGAKPGPCAMNVDVSLGREMLGRGYNDVLNGATELEVFSPLSQSASSRVDECSVCILSGERGRSGCCLELPSRCGCGEGYGASWNYPCRVSVWPCPGIALCVVRTNVIPGTKMPRPSRHPYVPMTITVVARSSGDSCRGTGNRVIYQRRAN